MTSAAQGLYSVLFPQKLTRSQEFWDKHFPVIENERGFTVHLSYIQMILQERIYFFRQSPDRNNALLLMVMATTAWALIRTLADISGNDSDWFRGTQKSLSDEVFEGAWGEDVLPFLRNMKEIHDVHSFLRHPSEKLKQYAWVFSKDWPKDKADMLITTADHLRTLLVFISNETSLSCGWQGDTEKQRLHDIAAANHQSASHSDTQKHTGTA